jgi:hypothetical protein
MGSIGRQTIWAWAALIAGLTVVISARLPTIDGPDGVVTSRSSSSDQPSEEEPFLQGPAR